MDDLAFEMAPQGRKPLVGIVMLLTFLLATSVHASSSTRAESRKGNFPAHEYTTQSFDRPFALVYVRVPKTRGRVDLSPVGIDRIHTQWGHFDRLPETKFIISGMSGPGQLIYRDRNGREKILFDCMEKDCLPMDPTVSFDGKSVIFSVLYAKFSPLRAKRLTLPNKVALKPREARLYVAHLESETVEPLAHQQGVFDTGPVFLPDGKIMFTSDRAKEIISTAQNYAPSRTKTFQLWIADPDGNNAIRVGPHDRDSSLHPFVMSDGRVLFSTWQISHLRNTVPTSGGAGRSPAMHNLFWLASVDHTGGAWNAVYGAHGRALTRSNQRADSIKALHFVTEATNGWLCTSNYYRGNNMGAGDLICWRREAVGIEGKAPSEVKRSSASFVPRKIVTPLLWTLSGDFGSKRNKQGEYLGKARDPMALPGNQLIFTYNRGFCAAWTPSFKSYLTEKMDCDAGIYKTTQIPSKGPEDLVAVVDHPHWHEFMARVAEPYQFIYGKDRPAIPKVHKDPENRCIIRSSTIAGEIKGVEKYRFSVPKHSNRRCAVQGCTSHNKSTADVSAIRFWEVLPNTADFFDGKSRLRSNVGHRYRLLGDVELQRDTSFAAQIPCDTPFIMAGVDQDGHVIARDQIAQSLRQGEVRTCNGCHMHSKQGKPFEGTVASRLLDIPKVGISNVPVIKGGEIVEGGKEPELLAYREHILPIFERRCVSCHVGENAAAGLRLDAKNSWYRLVWDRRQEHVVNPNPSGPLEHPNTSRYVNAAFSIESLLYWKAANQRMDGVTDDTYDDDVDFGENHPTSITASELRTLRDWLDSGAYAEYKKRRL